MQGWKLPDRRAEHASSLPASHQRPARQRGRGSPAESGAPLPDDAFGGHCRRGAGQGWSLPFPGLGLHRLSVHGKAPSSLPSEDPAAVHGRTDPSSHPPQHSTNPGCSAGATASWCHQPGPHSPGDGPWGSHSPQSPRVPVPAPPVPAAAQPRAGRALLGDLSMCQLCRVPCPGHEAGHVLTRPSLCSSHSSPSPPSPKQ